MILVTCLALFSLPHPITCTLIPPTFPRLSIHSHSPSNGHRRVSMKERSLASDTLKHNHSKTPEVHLIKKRGRGGGRGRGGRGRGGRGRGERGRGGRGRGGRGREGKEGEVHLINNDTLPPNLNSIVFTIIHISRKTVPLFHYLSLFVYHWEC